MELLRCILERELVGLNNLKDSDIAVDKGTQAYLQRRIDENTAAIKILTPTVGEIWNKARELNTVDFCTWLTGERYNG